jgi:chitin disaccharide deacetylase
MSQSIILCADDFGQNKAISEGIMRLIECKRINAVSCMVTTPFWPHTYSHIQRANVFIGLHLTLTHGHALSLAWRKHYGTFFPGLSKLIRDAYFHRLNLDVVTEEIQMQVDVFKDAMNQAPDFIDGHQHVHQLPIIRDALFAVLSKQSEVGFIRSTSCSWRECCTLVGFPKRQIISCLGGRTLHHQLEQRHIFKNTQFSGIYPFTQAAHYRSYFKKFLIHSCDGGLIMCHPGNPSTDSSDPLAPYRPFEQAYFLSDEYVMDMSQHNCVLRTKTGAL